MTVLRRNEVPEAIQAEVDKLRKKYFVGEDDVYVVDAEHENMSEGSYGISAEILTDFVDWMSEVKVEGPWWTERATSWCLAVHPK